MTTPEAGKDTNALRRTPKEIKNGLELCSHEGQGEEIICNRCSYDCNGSPFLECTRHLAKDALAYIQQLETTYSQVSKSLCGKGNATPEEILQEFSQVKSRLAQAERERDAMHRDMKLYCRCKACKKFVDGEDCPVHAECTYGNENLFEWRGLCPENTKEA